MKPMLIPSLHLAGRLPKPTAGVALWQVFPDPNAENSIKPGKYPMDYAASRIFCPSRHHPYRPAWTFPLPLFA